LDQLRLGGLAQADADIGLAHSKVELVVAEQEGDGNFGIEIEKFTEQRRQPAAAEADRCRYAQLAMRAFAAVGQEQLGRFELGEKLLGGTEQKFALLSQQKAAGVAVKKRNLQFLFERGHLAA